MIFTVFLMLHCRTIPHGLACDLKTNPAPYNLMPNTDSEACSRPQSRSIEDLNMVPTNDPSCWRTVASLFQRSQFSNRKMYLIVCGIMADVTDLRFNLRQQRFKEPMEKRLREMVTAVASIRMVLPAWYLNPVRCVVKDEIWQEHHIRLETLLILCWFVATQTLPISR